MKNNLFLIGSGYALNNYLRSHKDILSERYCVSYVALEDILDSYNRRASLIELCRYIYQFSVHFRNSPPRIIVSVGPLAGAINIASSLFLGHKPWHWFTGLVWCNSSTPFLEPTLYVDIFIAFFAARLFADSHWQKNFLLSSIYFRFLHASRIRVPACSSITPVDQEIYSIRKDKIYYHNSLLPNVCVGYLGRLTLDKGVNLIKPIAEKASSIKSISHLEIEYFICGPIDATLYRKGACSAHMKESDFLKELDLDSQYLNVNPGIFDKIEFFKRIDILLLPSRREGFGLVAVEAISAGIPVVCSRIGPLLESVPSLKCGYHCDTIEDYANAISMCCNRNTYKILHEQCIEVSSQYHPVAHRKHLHATYYSK